MRRAKVDANQKEIVKALRAAGATVAHTHTVGDGFVDIVVLYRRRVYLMEIKDGDKPLSAQKLTPKEEKFHAVWGEVAHVVNSISLALFIIGATPTEKDHA